MNTTITPDAAENDENSWHLELAGRFILSLIQALLRTGYYLPDHPESRKAKSSIYDSFISLTTQSREITLYIAEIKGKRAVLIEGITATPVTLSSVMQLGMAETYTPRIIQFLDRKELICLTFKAELEEHEFCQLIDILSEPPSPDQDGGALRANFLAALTQHAIHNISFIFREDIICSRMNLPWRVRMALTRLSKDLHLIPILRNLREEELHQVKMQVLSDIIRPLAAPELAYIFLLNLDLVDSTVISEEVGESHFFDLATEELIIAVAKLYMRDAVARSGFPEHVSTAKKTRLLSEFCQRLGATNNPQAASLLETFFDNGLISFEDLPEVLRTKIECIKRLSVFQKQPDTFLASLDSISDPVKYEPRARILAGFVLVLIERGEFSQAIPILSIIAKHSQEQSARAPFATICKSEVAFGGSLELASSSFLTASKESRTVIGRLFQLIGCQAISHVQSILIKSDDQWKSKQAAEILIGMGSLAIDSLLSAMDNNRITMVSLPVVIRVLGECSLTAEQKEYAASILQNLLNDAQSECCHEAALLGLARIGAAGSFPLFKSKLESPALGIRKAAAFGIGRSGDRRGGALLVALIEKVEKNDREVDQELTIAAIEALGTLMNSCPAFYDTGLACLADLVERYCTRKTWNILLGGSIVLPECLALSLTETLGRLHGDVIRKLLTKLSSHHYPSVAKRAREILAIAV